MSSKFERGLAYKFPILTNTFGYPMVFDDKPHCPRAQETWEARQALREGMTPEERLKEVAKNGYFPPNLPTGYDRSCDCDVCRRAWQGTYFKGLLGRPSDRWGSTDPGYVENTLMEAGENFNKSYKIFKKTVSPETLVAIQGALQGKPQIILLDTNRSGFQAVMFKLIWAQWDKMTTGGVYYNTPPEKSRSTKHPQPDWTILSNLDELLTMAKDPEISEIVVDRPLMGVSAIGPMSPAQALLAFGPIRTAASKDATVVVNINDETLTRYVKDLIKSLE